MFKTLSISTYFLTSLLSLQQIALAAPSKALKSRTQPKSAAQKETNANKIDFDNLGFHLGSLTEFVGSVQIDDSGKKNFFEINPFIGFSTQISLSPDWVFLPEFNWVLPREAGSGISKNLFMVRGDFGYNYQDWLRLRVGSSLMINNIRGAGGSRPMNNGSGQSDFFLPPESKTSINNTLDLGIELHSEELALRFQNYWYAILNNERRQLSYSLTLTYYYDLKE